MITIQDAPGNINSKLEALDNQDYYIKGLGGNDELISKDGNDILDGGKGNDKMIGGRGNDTYYVDSAGDTIVEQMDQGNDTVFSTRSYSLLGTHLENLTLLKGGVWGEGNFFNNTLTGNAANNKFWGYEGADTIDGKAGADYMAGGKNDDTYYVDNTGDKVVEFAGEGKDKIISSINYDLKNAAEVENLTLTGNAGFGYGNALNNTIFGNERHNTLTGAGGDDIIWGFAGSDLIDGGIGSDRLYGGIGNDSVTGGTGVDLIVGSFVGASTTEVDTLRGGATNLTGIAAAIDLQTQDTFVLGENLPLIGATVYYAKGGVNDYALIKDFNGNVDKIQVAGSLNDYSIQGISHSGKADIDAGIYYKGDLVAVLQDTTNVTIGTNFVMA